MSGSNTPPAADAVKPTKVTGQQRGFVNRRVLKREVRIDRDPGAQAAHAKALFEAAYAKAAPTLAAAEKLLSRRAPPPQELVTATSQCIKAVMDLEADKDGPDYAKAQASLAAAGAAARNLMVAKGRFDAGVLRSKQVAAQVEDYDRLAPVLDRVKRTYLPEGGARQMAAENLRPGDEFKAFLAALQTLETSKTALKPAGGQPAATPQQVLADCDAVTAAAQAYLVHFKDLSTRAAGSKESQAKKRHCEDTMLAVRQYAMAMTLDSVGAPTAAQPWDREAEMRVAGLRYAMDFEGGYFKAKGLGDDGGAGGASASYWIRGGSVEEGKDNAGKPAATIVASQRGKAIFKPTAGEQTPDHSSDRKGAGAVKEALASANARMFGAMTGIDLGVPDTHVVSVGGYAVQGDHGSNEPLVGSAQQHAGVSKQINDLAPDIRKKITAAEAHRIALLDIMSLSVDRHGGNIMVDDADPANVRLVPIDHGATLPSRGDFDELKARMAGVVFHPPSVGNSDGQVQTFNTLLSLPASFEAFDPDMQARLDLLDPAAMEQGMKDQRTALDNVHPGLGARDKVRDDSLHMSKRSMMFLKKAAGQMSPAEIQVALGVHGEALFDADDAAFDGVAASVIAEAVPKKAAYQEFLTTPADQQLGMLTWMNENGWVMPGEAGKASPAALMMRDPVNMLRVVKSRTPNPNPPATTQQRVPDAVPAAGADPTEAEKQAIMAAFPKVTSNANSAVWRVRKGQWDAMAALGGFAAIDAMLAATGTSDSIKLENATQPLLLWEEINKPENAAALAAIIPSPRAAEVTLARALARTANQQAAAQVVAQLGTTAAAVDEGAAADAEASRLLTALYPMLDSLTDPEAAKKFRSATQAATGRLQAGDATGAAGELRAIITDVEAVSVSEVRAKATELLDELTKRQLSTTQLYDLKNWRANTQQFSGWKAGQAVLGAVRAFAAKTLPEAVPNRPGSPSPEPVQDAAVADIPTRPEKKIPSKPLPGFTWDLAQASAAKKQAVAQKVISDRRTGLTGALMTVLQARVAFGQLDPAATDGTRLAGLETMRAAYEAFSLFVASQLRGVSSDPVWTAYCDTAASQTSAAMKPLAAEIATLKAAAAAAQQGGPGATS